MTDQKVLRATLVGELLEEALPGTEVFSKDEPALHCRRYIVLHPHGLWTELSVPGHLFEAPLREFVEYATEQVGEHAARITLADRLDKALQSQKADGAEGSAVDTVTTEDRIDDIRTWFASGGEADNLAFEETHVSEYLTNRVTQAQELAELTGVEFPEWSIRVWREHTGDMIARLKLTGWAEATEVTVLPQEQQDEAGWSHSRREVRARILREWLDNALADTGVKL